MCYTPTTSYSKHQDACTQNPQAIEQGDRVFTGKNNGVNSSKMRVLFSGRGKAEENMGLAPLPALKSPAANNIWRNW